MSHVIAEGKQFDSSVSIFQPVIMLRPEKIQIGKHTRIDSYTKFEGGEGLTIGEYVHIASYAHIGVGGGTTIIDDYCCVASGGKVISGSNKTDALSMSCVAPRDMQHIEHYTTHLKRYACVFAGAIVLPGITMGEGSILSAGSVATRDIPDWEIWAGFPARFIIKRRVGRTV